MNFMENGKKLSFQSRTLKKDLKNTFLKSLKTPETID